MSHTQDPVIPKRGALIKSLFFSTLRLSAVTFGGGAVIVPLMRKRFCDELGYINERQMLDLIAIAQSAPGPIVVNVALALGFRLAGVRGALAALSGTVIPPLFIITLVSFLYNSLRDNPVLERAMLGMQAGVAAVVCSAVWDLARGVAGDGGALSVLVMIAAFAVAVLLRVHIVLILLVCAGLGLVAGRIKRGAGKT